MVWAATMCGGKPGAALCSTLLIFNNGLTPAAGVVAADPEVIVRLRIDNPPLLLPTG